MKKILLSLSLALAAFFSASAQNMYDLYSGYETHESQNNTAEIFKLKPGISMAFSYLNMPWVNRKANPNPSLNGVLATEHGFSYAAEYMMPIWGPIGINWRFLDFSFALGNWNPSRLGVPPDKGSKDHLGFNISLGIGIMPTLGFNFGPVRTIFYGGLKGYLNFIDGASGYYPINCEDKSSKNIGSIAFATYMAGIDLVFGNFGLRFNYEWGWTNRLKDQYYPTYASSEGLQHQLYHDYNGDPTRTRDVYNPRYDIITVGFVYWFDL